MRSERVSERVDRRTSGRPLSARPLWVLATRDVEQRHQQVQERLVHSGHLSNQPRRHVIDEAWKVSPRRSLLAREQPTRGDLRKDPHIYRSARVAMLRARPTFIPAACHASVLTYVVVFILFYACMACETRAQVSAEDIERARCARTR